MFDAYNQVLLLKLNLKIGLARICVVKADLTGGHAVKPSGGKW